MDTSNQVNESLRDWFKKEDWVRINTSGNIAGKCGTMKKGKATTRCLPRAKASNMTKAERKATVAKKVRGSKKGKQFVSVNEGYEEIVRENDSKEFAKYLREICKPENIQEAKFKGRTVTLNKPMRGDSKKFKVYVNSGKKNADGTIKTGSSLASFDADLNSGNIRLLATPTSSDSTVFKVFRTTMNA